MKAFKPTYTIQAYDYTVSVWVNVAELAFEPDEILAERIVDAWSDNYLSCYSKIRITRGRETVRTIDFEE